jgi:hypothetical protein
MLCRLTVVRTDDSEKSSSSIIKVTRIGELGTTLAETSNPHMLRRKIIQLLVNANVVPSKPILFTDDGGATILPNIGSYKSHTA